MVMTGRKCKHPFPVQHVAGDYVVCIQCGKQLALADGPVNQVFDPKDYEKNH